MRSYQIITDAASDVGEALCDALNIERIDVILTRQNGERYLPPEGEGAASAFYAMLRAGERIGVRGVDEEHLRKRFRMTAEADVDILYLGCSGALSDSLSVARAVTREIAEAYPGVSVRCVDTLRVSLGAGMAAIRAARLREQGLSAEKTADEIERTVGRTMQFGTVEDLRFLRRAGHLTLPRSVFDRLTRRRPVLAADNRGHFVIPEHPKGRAGALSALAERLTKAVGKQPSGDIDVAHADARESAEIVAAQIRAAIPDAVVNVREMGPVTGAVMGPGAVMVCGVGPL